MMTTFPTFLSNSSLKESWSLTHVTDTDSVNDIDMEQPAIYDKDDWKKEIMIGAEHQAEVPNFKVPLAR